MSNEFEQSLRGIKEAGRQKELDEKKREAEVKKRDEQNEIKKESHIARAQEHLLPLIETVNAVLLDGKGQISTSNSWDQSLVSQTTPLITKITLSWTIFPSYGRKEEHEMSLSLQGQHNASFESGHRYLESSSDFDELVSSPPTYLGPQTKFGFSLKNWQREVVERRIIHAIKSGATKNC